MEFLTPSALKEKRPMHIDVDIPEGKIRVLRLGLEDTISFVSEFTQMPEELTKEDAAQGEYLRWASPILSRCLDGGWDNPEGHELIRSLSPFSINKIQEAAFELNGLSGFDLAIEEGEEEAKND